jgi:hypothetical protein
METEGMKPLFAWITANPQAFKAYLLAIIALIAKGILALTGKVADLGQWSGFVDQAVDLMVGGITVYGLISGTVHTAQGPTLSSTAQASVIVAALSPAPVVQAVAQVQAIVADVVAIKPPAAETVESPHRF